MEIVEVPNTETLPLFLHQQKAVAALNEYFRPELKRKKGMLVMPTGSGKTMTAVHWLLREKVAKGEPVLWLVHRTDLIDQAADAFIKIANLLQESEREQFTMCKIS
ncbi:MAG: DEAD/DEAH box helicase, partial [Turicibacter sp.]